MSRAAEKQAAHDRWLRAMNRACDVYLRIHSLEVGEYTRQCVEERRALLLTVTPDIYAVCAVWEGDRFGLPIANEHWHRSDAVGKTIARARATVEVLQAESPVPSDVTPGVYELELKPARDLHAFDRPEVEAWIRLTLPYEWTLIRWQVRDDIVLATAELSAPSRG